MKQKIITIGFIIYIITFSLLGIILPDKEISLSERRKLAKFPEYTLDNNYVNKLDKYFLDHYPARDTLRSIKANFNYKVLKKLDNNGIYLNNQGIFKSEYPTNYKSVDNFIDKTNKILDMLSPNNKTYMMIIPDKNYYLKTDNFLQIDYDYIYNELTKLALSNIEIRPLLTINDYYQTDTHWRQENLGKIVKEMSKTMNFNYQDKYYKVNTYDNFYGVYYGESAMNINPDKLTYLTNNELDSLIVNYLENKELTTIYNIDNLTSIDSYEVFLDGASSFIEITNRNSKSNKELVIFRDSFASSITPLLTPYYKKITLIDNRYINTDNFKTLINFNNQDILFMYSTLIINNSSTLKG